MRYSNAVVGFTGLAACMVALVGGCSGSSAAPPTSANADTGAPVASTGPAPSVAQPPVQAPASAASTANASGVPAAGTDTATFSDSSSNTWTQTITFGTPEAGTAPNVGAIQGALSDCDTDVTGSPSEQLIVPFQITVTLTSTEPLTDFQVYPQVLSASNSGVGTVLFVYAYNQDGSTQYGCTGEMIGGTFEFDQLTQGQQNTGQFWMVASNIYNGSGRPDEVAIAQLFLSVRGGEDPTAEGTTTKATGPDVCGGSGTPNLYVTGLRLPAATASAEMIDCTFPSQSVL